MYNGINNIFSNKFEKLFENIFLSIRFGYPGWKMSSLLLAGFLKDYLLNYMVHEKETMGIFVLTRKKMVYVIHKRSAKPHLW